MFSIYVCLLPYQLAVVRDEVPDDGVCGRVTVCLRAVRGSQHHQLTLDRIHICLGHHDLGPYACMEEEKRRVSA